MIQRQIDFINAQVESSLPLGLSGAELWLYAAPRTWERHPAQALRKALFACPAIKWERYLEFYPDVAQAGMNPYLHFIKYGRKEKRQLPSAFSGAETFRHSGDWQDTQETYHIRYLPDSLDEPELAKLAAEYGTTRKFYEAYLCCMALYLRFGSKRDYLCLAGDQLAGLGRHNHAEILYEQYLEMGGLPTTEMARHTLMGGGTEPPNS